MSNLSNSLRKSILAEKEITEVNPPVKKKAVKSAAPKATQKGTANDLLAIKQDSLLLESDSIKDSQTNIKQNVSADNLAKQLFELLKDYTAIPVEGVEDLTIINVNVMKQLLLDYKEIFTKLSPLDFMSNFNQIICKNKEINSDYWQALKVSLSLTHNRINQTLQHQYSVFGKNNYFNLFSNLFMNFNKPKTNT